MIAPADFSAPPPATATAIAAPTAGAGRTAASCQDALRDAELVRRFNAGDDSAFAEIVNHYRERLFSLAFAMLKNRGDAEEIAQDAFIRAHRALPQFRGDASLATWLHRITLNLARNRYWFFFRRRRHATLSLDCPIGEDGDAVLADLFS